VNSLENIDELEISISDIPQEENKTYYRCYAKEIDHLR
jgi:hypothetical protein